MLPASFTVLDASLTGTSNGGDWMLSRSGNRVQVNGDGGARKLSQDEWVDFVVQATADPGRIVRLGRVGQPFPELRRRADQPDGPDRDRSLSRAARPPSSTPAPGPVATGWQLGLGPTSVLLGSTTDFTLRLTDTSGSDDIGCLRMQVASGFTVLDATVTGTNPAATWSAGTFGNFVWVRNPDGAGKLTGGEWVDFTVRARADALGSQAWTGVVVQNSSCFGSAFLASP